MSVTAWWPVGAGSLVLAGVPACARGPAAAAESAAPLPAASAPDAGAADTAPLADPAGEAVGALASTRRAVRSATVWLARSIDSWFGDQPFDEASAVSDGRLSLHLMTRQGEDPEARLRFNARMRLPNVERQTTYLFLGRDDAREIVKDRPEEVSPQQLPLRTDTTDPSFFAGLGLTLKDVIDFRLGFRGGLKPYAQARYRHAWALSDADLMLIVSGEQNPGVPVSDYGLQLKWEQPVHEDWLLVEIIVGHFRPRDTAQETRGSEWALGAGLKLRF